MAPTTFDDFSTPLGQQDSGSPYAVNDLTKGPKARHRPLSPIVLVVFSALSIIVGGVIGSVLYSLFYTSRVPAGVDAAAASASAEIGIVQVAVGHLCGFSCAAFPCPPEAFCECEECPSAEQHTDEFLPIMYRNVVYARAKHREAVALALPCSLKLTTTLSTGVSATLDEAAALYADRNCTGDAPVLEGLDARHDAKDGDAAEASPNDPSTDASSGVISEDGVSTFQALDLSVGGDGGDGSDGSVEPASVGNGAGNGSGGGDVEMGGAAGDDGTISHRDIDTVNEPRAIDEPVKEKMSSRDIDTVDEPRDIDTVDEPRDIDTISPSESRKRDAAAAFDALVGGALREGTEQPRAELRIVGGTQTAISNIPYQVRVQLGQFMCGGSILSSRWILTAAHCCEGRSTNNCNVNVQFGQTNVVGYGGGGGSCSAAATSTTHRCVSAAYSHPLYSRSSLDHDICLLRLAQPLPASPSWKAIPLLAGVPADGTAVQVSGWGSIYSGGPTSSSLLRADLKTVSRTLLRRQYPFATEGMLGAYAQGKDACQGDSGGPLTALAADGQRALVGVVSFGSGCASGHVGVYFHPHHALSWIQTTLASDDPCASAPAPVVSPPPPTRPAPSPLPPPAPRPSPPPSPAPPGPSGVTSNMAWLSILLQGGKHPFEKWVSISTGRNGGGSTIWASGSTCGAGAGVGRGAIYVTCGVTLWFNAYDQYADGWDGTTYTLMDGSGKVLANNGGKSPDDGVDRDYYRSFDNPYRRTCLSSELESSESFVVPCSATGSHRPAPRAVRCVAPEVRYGDCVEKPVGGLFAVGQTCTPQCAEGYWPTVTEPIACSEAGTFESPFTCCASCDHRSTFQDGALHFPVGH